MRHAEIHQQFGFVRADDNDVLRDAVKCLNVRAQFEVVFYIDILDGDRPRQLRFSLRFSPAAREQERERRRQCV